MALNAELSRLPTRRRLTNAVTRYVVALGGAAVIGAIALIFFYLLWVAIPIMAGAEVEAGQPLSLPAGRPLLLEANETGEIGLRIDESGQAIFFSLEDGSIVDQVELASSLRRVKAVVPHSAMYAVHSLERGVAIYEAQHPVTFDDDVRQLQPELNAVFPDSWIDVEAGADFDVYFADLELLVVALDGTDLQIQHYRDAEAGFELYEPRSANVTLERRYDRVIVGPRAAWVYLIAGDGAVAVLDLRRPMAPRQIFVSKLVPEGTSLTALEPLLGRYSLMAGDDAGRVTQWFMVPGEFGYALERARSFDLARPVTRLIPEQRRKGLGAVDDQGRFSLLYTTSSRVLTDRMLEPNRFATASIAPRANLLLTGDADGLVTSYRIHNEHPEISWSALWSKIWYEGYPEPVHSWQSSSADNDFEAKFSLTPLLFGTLKAAFYAMVFAVPIAIMGAIYTAYFMAPSMRRIVKPGVEIMAALPTVILGFLAGLWLAPLIEANLAGVISSILALPVGILLTAVLWGRLPDKLTSRFDGWYGMFVLPMIILTVAAGFGLGPWVETTFFAGNTTGWFLNELGLDYDQRNALVVGLAMGLAVIPAIFSITEDAIYGVPTHLINGSLALGATPWQTLVRVVILTASPGIFSAVMIGLGRAVGETMIVLMATGNTPVMDMNIFEGMRTFAANIAVELPESEVDSTHYRILFLTALVLFLITFIFNTAAEVVRQQLRSRYGNL